MVSVHEIARTPTPSTPNLQLRASPGAQSIMTGSWRGSVCNLGSHGPWRCAMGGLGDTHHVQTLAGLPAARPIALQSGS